MTNNEMAYNRISAKLSTKELAAFFKVEATSIRSALSAKGNFWGLVPEKAPNGRLIWDLEKAEALIKKAA
jgi:hypothetical protein